MIRVLCLAALLLVVFSGGVSERSAAEGVRSYYDSVMSLVDRRASPPKAPSKEALVISPPSGAMGLSFGCTMDDLVKLWGKPDRLSMEEKHLGFGSSGELLIENRTKLEYSGGMCFAFKANALFRIQCQGQPNAAFANGLRIGANEAAIKKHLGEPVKQTEWFAGSEKWDYDVEGCGVVLGVRDGKLRFASLERH
jgi:hypothetical protein